MSNSITMRDFLNAVVKSSIANCYKDFAESELAKLDQRNEKRRNTMTAEQKENVLRMSAIFDYVSGCKSGAVASEIATALELSTQRVSALCRKLVEDGKLEVSEVKIKGGSKVKLYRAIDLPEESDESEED